MSSIKGPRREEREFEKFVGFFKATVVAINPDREELNVLFGKEDKPEDKPIEYVGTDNDGNDKVRISFWLKDVKSGKLFPHNITIINKERLDQKGIKNQYINNVLDTGWAADPKSELPDFFTNFLNKEKEVVGEKTYHKAKVGEEELGIIVKAWLGKLNFNHPECNAEIDVNKLLAGNYNELRCHILPSNATEEEKKDSLSAPFVALAGVKTDEDDSDKQYQQIFSKAFLPGGFIAYINNGLKFPTDYSRNVWKSFQKKKDDLDNNGKYGFKAYHELVPLTKYDKSKDVAQGGEASETEVTETNDEYNR